MNTDIYFNLFSIMEVKDILSMSSTCTTIRKLQDDREITGNCLWKNLFVRDLHLCDENNQYHKYLDKYTTITRILISIPFLGIEK